MHPRSIRTFFLLTAILAVSVIVGLPAAQQAPPNPPAPVIATGFVAGQVIDGPSGQPVPEAVVNMTGRGAAAPAAVPGMRGSAAWSVFAVADPQGRFFFGNIPPGNYTINATKPGYTRPQGGAPVGTAVELGDAERITNALVRLVKAATMTGMLRDEAGDPVVGTVVIAGRRTVSNGLPALQIASSSRSDDRGMFRFSNLAPGDYLVCACSRDPIPFDQTLLTTLASQPLQLITLAGRAITSGADAVSLDNALRTYGPAFYPNSPTAARATVVTVASGEEKTNVDIAVPLVRAARVTGRIIGAQSPVHASALFLVSLDETTGYSVTAMPPMLVQPDGRFDFANVPPGQYRLVVNHRETGARGGGPSGAAMGFVGGRGIVVPSGATMSAGGPAPLDEPPLWADEVVTVGERSTVVVDVVLQRGARISGRVVLPGGQGGMVGQQPIRMQITLASLGQIPTLQVGVVGADGSSFTVNASAPGKYGLGFTASPGFVVRSVTLGGLDVTDLPIDVGARDLTGLEILVTNQPLAALTVTTPPVQAGQAPRDDVLLVFPADRRYWASPAASRARYRTAQLTPKGMATASDLPAGEYLVLLVPPHESLDWQEQTRMDALSRRAQTVTILDGEKKTIEVRR